MHDVENGYYQDRDTEFVINGKKYTAHEWGSTLNVYGFTPEQVIAATLGHGECHMEQTCHERIAGWDVYHDEFVCSECGGEMFEGYNFCPSCGCKVVDE